MRTQFLEILVNAMYVTNSNKRKTLFMFCQNYIEGIFGFDVRTLTFRDYLWKKGYSVTKVTIWIDLFESKTLLFCKIFRYLTRLHIILVHSPWIQITPLQTALIPSP